jgi:hypothetical protein
VTTMLPKRRPSGTILSWIPALHCPPIPVFNGVTWASPGSKTWPGNQEGHQGFHSPTGPGAQVQGPWSWQRQEGNATAGTNATKATPGGRDLYPGMLVTCFGQVKSLLRQVLFPFTRTKSADKTVAINLVYLSPISIGKSWVQTRPGTRKATMVFNNATKATPRRQRHEGTNATRATPRRQRHEGTNQEGHQGFHSPTGPGAQVLGRGSWQRHKGNATAGTNATKASRKATMAFTASQTATPTIQFSPVIADSALQIWSGNFPALMRTRHQTPMSIQQNGVVTVPNCRNNFFS